MKLRLDEPDRALRLVLVVVIVALGLLLVACGDETELTICTDKATKDCTVSRSEPGVR